MDLWSIESQLYAKISGEGIRGESELRESFDLGNNHLVDVRLINLSKTPISNHTTVNASEFIISLNFRKENEIWFRVDNQSKDVGKSQNYLHFHSDGRGRKFIEHQEISGQYTVAQIISITFDSTYRIIKEKYPYEKIHDGDGFVGFA